MARVMKDSGIEWIGEIPANWDLQKGKYLYCQRSEKGNSVELQLLSPTQKYGVIPQSLYEKISGMKPVQLDAKADLEQFKSIYSGDFCISLRSFQGGFEYSQYNGVVSPAYQVFYRQNDTTSDAFYRYIFKEVGFIGYMNSFTKSFRDGKSIAFDDFAGTLLPVPPIAEQQSIADFLDRKCAEIDAVMEKTKATIEEYKKLKQSVITEAVTKGIRGNRAMKDSGIEWIGEMPSDWPLIPFRHVLYERQEKNAPIVSTERLSLSIDMGVTLYAEKTTNLDRFKDDFEQYKLAYPGDLVMNSMNMIVGATGVSDYFGCVSPVYYTFYDKESDHITAKFCEYIFRSKTMLRLLFSLGKGIYAIVRGDDRVNTCRLKVSKEDLKSILLPIPAVEEQREIVSFLNEKCAALDTLIAKKTALLTELETYKKSLVYEYVTGKKEVPYVEETY